MLIPIGSMCRAAFQVNSYLKSKGLTTTPYPYDWTITPFTALEATLSKKFNTCSILELDNLKLNNLGSITDERTGIIHIHDFPPPVIKDIMPKGLQKDIGIIRSPQLTKMREKASGRFIHTYKNLELLKTKESKKILFIRWQRYVHQGENLSHLFIGEDIASLSNVIKNFLLHDNFSILTVKSRVIHRRLPKNTIIEYSRSEHGVSSIIIERKGFNGDGTDNFRGDTVSWHKLLNKFIGEEKVQLD